MFTRSVETNDAIRKTVENIESNVGELKDELKKSIENGNQRTDELMNFMRVCL